MAHRNRPLSPFMLGTLYRLQMTSVLSLMHRVTGIVASVGAFGLAWWLLAVAEGGEAYATASAYLGSTLGMVALAAFTFSLVYHLLNGIRHLMWDAGWGFELPEVYRSGYVVIVLSVVLTAAIWFVALRGAA
ncbi:succinate dehydrogenase, cytochrome b556 subunit [Luteimonas deserti]|uniref:Succinate dehydrogenase cytochrome b556 subunit n=1 Tax=Luteimonas deserti TaxID=2752306 RepID=A0A7Z0QSN9_9GAMM|nr:succinate dehydrogenase, cytochrome b556 subunit [Luteimonas deserti]NYZ64194.1 succinate dehydrogenase, cytochrome b556 subunit [Luteimonas deserti]